MYSVHLQLQHVSCRIFLRINDPRDNLGYAFKVVAVAVPLLSYLRRTVDVSSDKILVLVGYVIITFLILVL